MINSSAIDTFLYVVDVLTLQDTPWSHDSNQLLTGFLDLVHPSNVIKFVAILLDTQHSVCPSGSCVIHKGLVHKGCELQDGKLQTNFNWTHWLIKKVYSAVVFCLGKTDVS